MTTPILSARVAKCTICLDHGTVPDPAGWSAWTACPACGGDDDPVATILPVEPVGQLEVWAVAADESACQCVSAGKPDLPDAAQVAVLSARILAPHPHFRGGELRVCDAAGHVWFRTPIRTAA